MANCTSCSAPLSGQSTICEYCNRRNDIDLHGIHKYTVMHPETERICPRCTIPLQTINLKKGDKFYIEQCTRCMGLFFDLNELEALLEMSVSNVFRIDQSRMNTINKELYHRDPALKKYVTCPVCSRFMHRSNFGAKSGVIADCCSSHGVWLDGGELKRLLEWKKAGGQLLHEKIKQRRGKSASKNSNGFHKSKADAIAGNQWDSSLSNLDTDNLVTSVFRLIDRLL
ncbi:MAG: zf-TFIIB domain-containing protein [Gammaproteobacteria bacterium]|nr:zf-TFIIB domain-containing protein [Gammaproteobacteria bacterium]